MAHLISSDLLPTICVPSKDTGAKKNILVIFDQNSDHEKNRIHDLLDRNHISQEKLKAFNDLYTESRDKVFKKYKN